MGNSQMTVGELKKHLASIPDTDKLSFAGNLTFHRIKKIADDEHFVEFSEAQGDLSKPFKQRNPEVQVVFFKAPDSPAPIQEITVTVL